MAVKDFIVAIELGSSKITGIAGKKNSDGSVHVLACASENSSSFIRKGVIYNLNKTAQSLTSIINQLEGALDATIAKVYVGIGGQSLRTVKNTVVHRLESENTISQELVDSLNHENTQVPLIDLDILGVVPQEYRIGNNFQIDPVGVISNHIEGRFLNIIARDSVKKNLEKCFQQANIEVAGYYISPLAVASVALTDNEKRSGCALIDLGADSTTVSVYKNNILRHLTVLPIGGDSITRDICNLQIEESEAEELKIKYGSAINEPEKDGEEPRIIQLQDKRTVEEKTLNDIIEARMEEIIANIWNQIQISGYDSQLLAGVILIGGGANMRNVKEAFTKKTKIEKVKIVNTIWQSVKEDDSRKVKNDSTFNSVLGLLYAGEENCCKPEEVKPVSSLFESEMTEAPDVDSEEERKKKDAERERKRLEEEERCRKKEEEKRNRKSWFTKIKESGSNTLGQLFEDEDK